MNNIPPENGGVFNWFVKALWLEEYFYLNMKIFLKNLKISV